MGSYGKPVARHRRCPRLLVASVAVALAGCATVSEPAFRIRADPQAPLNADTGWAGKTNEQTAVAADRPFRLRMEVEPSEGARQFGLQVRRNGGRWQPVEAHDFPYPQREVKISFDGMAPGSTPPDWSVVRGAASDLTVVTEGPSQLLRASGGESGLMALYEAPWPLAAFTMGAEFRLPHGARDALGMIFAYANPDNHHRALFGADGLIRIIRVADGHETLLEQQRAPITPGAWHEAEIQLKDGTLEVKFDDDTLEFQVRVGADWPASNPGLLIPPRGRVEFREIVVEGEPSTPGVSIVATLAYANGAATQDLLPGSAAPFASGFGLSLTERTPRWTGAGRHGEFEWPLVIRRHADGPAVNKAGDRFEFRMVDSAAQPVPGAVARASLMIPPGHLGGTFVETPGRIGPWQAENGDLYFIMEPTETDNRFMMMKSTDGGLGWNEVDGGNRPETGDLESVDGRQAGGTIHIIHQVTQSVRHHAFHTSDHPTRPDRWAIRDEVAAEAEAVAQMTTLVVRSDGSMATIFLADRLHYALRSADGRWSPAVEIDPGAAERNAGPQAILGRGDVVHLAYFADDGVLWYRRLLPDGTLTERQRLATGAGTTRAEYGAVLPLAYDERTDTVIIVYRLADGTLWERRVAGDQAPGAPILVTDRRVITDAVDAQQPAADVVFDGETAHVLFVDEASRSLFSTRRGRGSAGWQAPVLRIDDIVGSWVRGNIIQKPDGSRAYGFVYDAGSQGGAGLNRYAEIPLQEN